MQRRAVQRRAGQCNAGQGSATQGRAVQRRAVQRRACSAGQGRAIAYSSKAVLTVMSECRWLSRDGCHCRLKAGEPLAESSQIHGHRVDCTRVLGRVGDGARSRHSVTSRRGVLHVGSVW